MNQAAKTLALIISLYVLALVSVGLRLVSRKLVHLKLSWDDWLALLAIVTLTVHFVCVVEVVHNGPGKTVSREHFVEVLRWLWGSEMTYSITVTCVKSSILCLYLRIFGVNRTFSSAVYCVMIRVIAWGISTLLSGLFSCTPQGVGILPGRCINMSTWFLVTTVSNVIIDFGILVLPLPVIWGLQLSTLRKAGLTGIFLLGIFTTTTSILRYYSNSIIVGAVSNWNYVTPFVIWSTVELAVGVICACLRVMAPLVRKLFGQKSKPPRSAAMQRYQHSDNSKQSRRPLCRENNLLRMEEDAGKCFPEPPGHNAGASAEGQRPGYGGE